MPKRSLTAKINYNERNMVYMEVKKVTKRNI